MTTPATLGDALRRIRALEEALRTVATRWDYETNRGCWCPPAWKMHHERTKSPCAHARAALAKGAP